MQCIHYLNVGWEDKILLRSNLFKTELLFFIICLLFGAECSASEKINFTGEKLVSQMPNKENLITHQSEKQDLTSIVAKLKGRIIRDGDKPDSTVKEQLDLVDQLMNFELGRFLLTNRGLNGVWTRYIVLYPKRRNEMVRMGQSLIGLEKWMLERAPVMRATQERFTHFQSLLQENVRSHMKLASVPCGMMDDLLTLNLSNYSDVKLVGIDLDDASLEGAKTTAIKLNLGAKTSFIKSDAWQLNALNEFDIMTSNGLNIYEPNDAKVVELYKNFYLALKPGGILVTSFLTPPLALSPESPWNLEKIDPEDLRLQKVIFSYILSIKWQSYRTEKQTLQQLKSAGFKNIRIIYDQAKTFPTVVAKK